MTSNLDKITNVNDVKFLIFQNSCSRNLFSQFIYNKFNVLNFIGIKTNVVDIYVCHGQ